ncbi:BBP7 family outer membrane beta-barrel protein [Rhodopirellula sp. JC740]|uniref:BBP7 family outer membrane beta-barrel protein n=1 Tax=Rhodopirellula halodulae TaxID=2894198 RepID=A0ABS8NEV9_9BACT|nr:BBP7 family outer membrane beta-barrel protein [Rhodopirellula sp. JC740]MCC9642094.1 BBP7 family outer membrane beta-barrel protein [Rhodopirellula sp. JC740]
MNTARIDPPIASRNRLLIWMMVCVVVLSGMLLQNTFAQDYGGASARAKASQPTEKMNWFPQTINGKAVGASEDDSDIAQVGYEPIEGEIIYEDGGHYDHSTVFEKYDHSTSACDGCGTCNQCVSTRTARCFWVRAEYLLWSLDGIDLPPLVTTSSAGTDPDDTGVLDQPNTRTLYGNNSVLDSMRSGLRVTVGWDDDSRGNGFELSGMGIFNDDEVFQSNASLLARPVFDTTAGSESSMLVAHPDFLTGSVQVRSENELSSFEFNRRHVLSAMRGQRVNVLVGYRYGNLDEMLRIDQSSVYTAARGSIPSGTTVELFDQFDAENQFHGAQIGLQLQRRTSITSWDAHAKIAFGVNRAETTIAGQTTNTVPGGGSSTFAGGLLAQSTNIGTYNESEFMVLPEIGLNFTAQVHRDLRLTLGYSMMVWSDAVRVDEAIDRNVSQFPPEAPTGTNQPAYELTTSSFIAHGLNFGATFRF